MPRASEAREDIEFKESNSSYTNNARGEGIRVANARLLSLIFGVNHDPLISYL